MNYLYHVVPENLRGDVLLPLHKLAEIHPDLAKEAARKYEGREHLMQVRIPILNCRWNDALHLTPLHPSKTRCALEEAGLPTRPLTFFRIPPSALSESHTVHFSNAADTQSRYDFPPSSFTPFNPMTYEELPSVPPAQSAYFAQMKLQNQRPLLWSRTPHVFHHGSLPVRSLDIIAW